MTTILSRNNLLNGCIKKCKKCQKELSKNVFTFHEMRCTGALLQEKQTTNFTTKRECNNSSGPSFIPETEGNNSIKNEINLKDSQLICKVTQGIHLDENKNKKPASNADVNLEKYSKGKNKNIMKVEYNSKQLKIDSYKSSKIDPEELEQLQEQMRCFDEIEFKNRKK